MSRSSKGGFETRLGYRFSDSSLLETALSHPSAAAPANYQRLEFLGDRVLGLTIADELYRQFAGENEGQLTTRFHLLVRKETLANIAEGLDLASEIQTARNFSNTSREREGALADVLEALLGAIYLDGGLEAARTVILRLWADRITAGDAQKDPKSALQEWLQGRGLPPPDYKVVERTGPDHAPDFNVRVRAGDLGDASARGLSKQKAEVEAATTLLQHLKNQEGPTS